MVERLLNQTARFLETLNGWQSLLCLFLVVVVPILIFCLIRDCFCWFFRTLKILEEIQGLYLGLKSLSIDIAAYKAELRATIKELGKTVPPAGGPSTTGKD